MLKCGMIVGILLLMNTLNQNRQDTAIAYSLQMGIPEWDNTTQYQYTSNSHASYVQRNGVVYKAIQTGTQQGVTILPMDYSHFTATQQGIPILPMGISRFSATQQVNLVHYSKSLVNRKNCLSALLKLKTLKLSIH